MTGYIALLRGINVGGKNKIKMADLRGMLEEIGLSQVKTYIQSGNVFFESEQEVGILQQQLESEIEKVFGFSVKVIVRTAEEVVQILENCPFSEEEISEAEASAEGESLYVAFLQDFPSQEEMTRLGAFKSDNEEYRVDGREIYLLFRQSIRNSRLANHLQKMTVPSTVRNWKTITKLATMERV